MVVYFPGTHAEQKDAPATLATPGGLDPAKRYRVREVNLPAGSTSALPQHDKVIDGATLMRDGVFPPCTKLCDSMVVELVAQ